MSSTEATNKAPAVPEKNNKLIREEPVLQVERRDFIDLVPEKRQRVQSLRGSMIVIPILSITSCVAPIKYGMNATWD